MGLFVKQSEINAFDRELNGCSTRPSGVAFTCVVNSEVGAVLAVMRRNVRWGVRYLAGDDHLEHSLIQSLKNLRSRIFSWRHHWHTINPSTYLQPFLDVIQSDETGAPITGVALSSVYKFLSLDILDIDTVNVVDAMHLIIDAVTSCRFEVTDPASEEVVLMKILQVLVACMRSKASTKLTNQHVCNIVNTCFRVVHQASSKGELLQRIARHTMHEMVRCIFSNLPNIVDNGHTLANGGRPDSTEETDFPTLTPSKEIKENGNLKLPYDGQELTKTDSKASAAMPAGTENQNNAGVSNGAESSENGEPVMSEPYGIPCMVEIFQFLCSLLNAVEQNEVGLRSNPIAYDEDVPLFALGLINSAIELGGSSFGQHPKLLSLIQDDLFRNLMQFGLSMSPLILSTVYSIVLNLYYHLRPELKLQLEAFFSSVLLKIAESKHGSSYQQQEVAMEALVDLCRQEMFMSEMYTNYDCDIDCSNVFEDIANLLSKSVFPVNSPLSAMNILALDGLVAMVQSMAERLGNTSPPSDPDSENCEEYKEFWSMTCESYSDPNYCIPFVRKMKSIKRRLTIGADHFNRDPKKGLGLIQGMHLLPDTLDPKSVACFFRYTAGLDKNLVGDYLGNHDEFCVQVLHEFARTFDFSDMSLDSALRFFIGTFRLPGESQKIQRVLEAFAERYYEQSPHVLVDRDAALLLSYSLILLNTDQHNAQVKKKMTEEDFIRNNRQINGGNDLPREILSELYRSICKNEIQMVPDQGVGFPIMTSSRWISLMHKSKKSTPYIICDSKALLDYDMFAILSGPTIAAISVVFDNVEQEDALQTCINGFLSVASISSCYHLDEVLNDLVVSLCKFTTLVTPSSYEEAVIALVEDPKARMATIAVFTIANKYGDCIRSGWKNILDCILSLQKFGLLNLPSESVGDLELSPETQQGRSANTSKPASQMPPVATPRKSSSFIGRFSQLLSFDAEEPSSPSTEEQTEAHQNACAIIQTCHIGNIFKESKFLQADSLSQLARAVISAAGKLDREYLSPQEEDTAVFCLELLIEITVNNRDRIMLLWQGIYEFISNIVQTTVMPCTLVEKAVFGLLQICQRLLPYKENLTDELLKSLQLILKLDARVADAYCEQITQQVMRLVKANATTIKSHSGWRTIISLLSITARHPEASDVGFETLAFIMSEGAHMSPANYVLCVDAARQFSESRVGQIERSVYALDLIAGSVDCLVRWQSEAKEAVGEEAVVRVHQDIGGMWLRLVQGLRKLCLDQREVVRNHAILMLQRCLSVLDGTHLPQTLWLQCFDLVIFTLLDDLLEITQESSPKLYPNMEGSLVLATKLQSKIFLQLMQDLYEQPSFCKLWVGVLNHMERYMKVKFKGKRSEKIHELIPELLKNILLVMKTSGVLVQNDAIASDSFWQLTWLHVKNIVPSLQEEVCGSDKTKLVSSTEIKS